MTPPTIMTIVEGHGEVAAIPALLRRLIPYLVLGAYADVPRPYRVPRDSLIKALGVETAVTAALSGKPPTVLISSAGERETLGADDAHPAMGSPGVLDQVHEGLRQRGLGGRGTPPSETWSVSLPDPAMVEGVGAHP
ncbi:hypothetical protein ACFHYQ_07275 [Sphaerimonospora cavernae]|uniref:Uncharacterized protein n=1 Tax=Sphaerimonospora cavernae TaxID=1740611 RepID=A0ABV6U238_9ACTN